MQLVRRNEMDTECRAPASAPARPDELVSDAVLDEVVQQLNEIHRGVALETALRIGRLIVDRFYGGDLTSWRTHRAKEASFRKLAARADRDLHISATGLYRAVALYELTERLNLKDVRDISVTQLRLVLGLPEPQQRLLLAQAQENGWQSQQLELEASRLRARLGKRSGRIPVPPLARVARTISQLSSRARSMVREEDFVRPLSRDQVRSVHQAIENARQELEQVQRLLLSAPQ
jgi:hypothetical protein